MKNKFIISTIIIIISTIQLFGNGFRIVKGKVVDNKDEVFIGAQIEEYKNGLNYVNSDINGEFEIVIPQKETVILRITYGCSAFYDVLYEVKAEDTYVRIEAYTKKADKKTKKIRRKIKKQKEENYSFFIRFDEGLNTKSSDIRSQIIKFGLLFPDWNTLKITAYQESEESGNELLDFAEKELLKINTLLKMEREVQINRGENLDKKIVKVEFKKEASR
jgi:hypothetical protein